MTVKEFLDEDIKKLNQIVTDYPKQIPIDIVADLFGCAVETVRTMCEENHTFGDGWRKPGKLNRGFCIPTGVFIRWYTKGIYIGNAD